MPDGQKETLVKNIIVSLLAFIALTGSSTAKAEDYMSASQDATVTLSATQSEAVSACVAAVMSCVGDGVSCAPRVDPVCDKAPPAARRKVKKAARLHWDCGLELRLLKGRVDVIERKLKEGSGGYDDSAIRAELDGLRQQLQATKDEIDGLRDELGGFIAEDARYKEILEATQLEDNREIEELQKRMAALEANLDPFELGIYGGVTGLLATGGTKGSAFVLRLEPDFRVTPKVDLIGHVSALIAADHNPFGAQVGGAIGYRFTNVVQARFGMSYAGIGYNNVLKAQAGFLTGDIGMRLTAKNGFAFLVNAGLGPKFTGTGDTSLGFSGTLAIGYNR